MNEYSENNCRICLKKCKKRDKLAAEFADKYFFCTGIFFESNDVPKKMCSQCRKDLTFASEFKQKCLDTEELLKPLAKEELMLEVLPEIKVELEEFVDLENKVNIVPDTNVEIEKQNTSPEVYEDVANTTANEGDIKPKKKKKKHKLTKTQMCNLCGIFVLHLGPHIRRVHADFTLRCDLCGKEYRSKEMLKIHMQKQHLKTCKYPCKYCDKVYLSHCARSNHVLSIHLKEFKYQCDQCDMKFIKSILLREHMTKHTGIQSFSCELCGKTFRKAMFLRHHNLSVHSTQTFSCSTCQKSFASYKYLKRHERVHSDDGYICPGCNKKHLVGQALRKHMQTHHPNIPQPAAGTDLKHFDWTSFLANFTENTSLCSAVRAPL